ncbi:MAG: hypothetical protein BWY92_01432 [Firmicutes bacterium ADurb.BinA052]|nr:MAG: hypothetical protein BWY92_01432 [Firmicutes bacterium ADurb.BinA052]
MRDQACILGLYGSPASQAHIERSVLRSVAPQSDVNRYAHIRIDTVGRCAGSTQPEFLLHSEYVVDLVHLGSRPPHGFDQHQARDPVIHGLSADTHAHIGEAPHHGGGIAYTHLGLRFCPITGADVDEHLVELEVLDVIELLSAEHAHCAVCENHLLAQQHVWAEPAHRRETHEALVVYVRYHDSDLIHVRIHHNALGR